MLDLLIRGRHLVFETPHDIDEATARLQRQIAPPAWQLYERRTQLFEGTLEAGRFRMIRLVRGRNSFRPFIEGQLLTRPSGTRVEVTLRLHPIVVVFCGALLAAGLAVTALLVWEALEAGQVSPQLLPALIVPLVTVVFLITLKVEAGKAARLLATILDLPPPGR